MTIGIVLFPSVQVETVDTVSANVVVVTALHPSTGTNIQLIHCLMTRYPDGSGDRVVLLTRTSTNGWLDWIHGDLWLLPSAIARIRTGVWRTLANSVRWLIGSYEDPQSVQPPKDLVAIYGSESQGRNQVPKSAVLKARLHRGLITDRLAFELRDGSIRKFLWLRNAEITNAVEDRIASWLNDDKLSRD